MHPHAPTTLRHPPPIPNGCCSVPSACIVAVGIIPLLVPLLGPGSPADVQVLAARILARLATADGNKVTIAAASGASGASGAIPLLVQLLKPGPNADAHASAAYALAELSRGSRHHARRGASKHASASRHRRAQSLCAARHRAANLLDAASPQETWRRPVSSTATTPRRGAATAPLPPPLPTAAAGTAAAAGAIRKNTCSRLQHSAACLLAM
jgi:hypothetical protein